MKEHFRPILTHQSGRTFESKAMALMREPGHVATNDEINIGYSFAWSWRMEPCFINPYVAPCLCR
jgi:hypothetical protein